MLPASAALLVAVLLNPLRAEVVGIKVEVREPFAAGKAFGAAGPYERLRGWLELAVDPDHPANAAVVDLKLAPRNASGKVAFRTEFILLKPLDPARSNHRLLYGVNNRGNVLELGTFNDATGTNDPATGAHAGNGFLLRQGYVLLWCGWNGDVAPGGSRLQIELPVATEAGREITARVYAEITTETPARSMPFAWGNSRPHEVADPASPDAVVTASRRRGEPAAVIPRDRWAFADFADGRETASRTSLLLRDGFEPGVLYDLVYTARAPRVTGLGLAAVRDAISFFKHAGAAGAAANPLAAAGGPSPIRLAYGFGISQSGRFLNHFLWQGFNEDEAGRQVFDAVWAHVSGGGKGLFNARFAQTTRHGSPHEDNFFPSDVFPFAAARSRDPVSGEEGDFLERARRSGKLPRIFFTSTSTEYWTRAASLLHADPAGERDLELDPNARLYFIAGAQHGVAGPGDRGGFKNERNTLDHRPVLRALLVALDEWAGAGVEPPPTDYPRVAAGTLVAFEEHQKTFPAVPGAARPAPPYAPLRLDLGPRFRTEGIADTVPPRAGAPYRTLVPQVNGDGNETAGIHLPDLAAPLGTYAGWNVRDGARSGADGALGRWNGSFIPFARTRREREERGDPRASIEERYATRDDYLGKIARAALELRARRLLLDEDVSRILETAAARSVP